MPDDYVKDHVIIYTRILRSVLDHNVEGHLLKVNNKLGDQSFDFQSTVDRNINLQNLKRASAFIDIMDRHLDTVWHSLLNVVDVILLIPVFQEAQDFLSYYRDVLAKDKMITNKGIYKRCMQLII